MQTDQRGLPTMTSRDDVSVAEQLLWSINMLSGVFAEQLRKFQQPLNLATRNLRKYSSYSTVNYVMMNDSSVTSL